MVSRKPLQKNRCLLQKRRIDIHVTKTSSRSRERRRRKPYVRKACHLLRCDAEDFSGNVTEVAELRVTERHRLLAEAAQRLAMLLRKTPSLLSALALGPRKPTDKTLRLCWRTFCLRRLCGLRPRCAHDSCHSSSAATSRSPAPPQVVPRRGLGLSARPEQAGVDGRPETRSYVAYDG